ncbi:uncharacterized [Tachysurus ichikawai]
MLARWEPPYTSLYKYPAIIVTPPDLRAPDIWARYGFFSSQTKQDSEPEEVSSQPPVRRRFGGTEEEKPDM